MAAGVGATGLRRWGGASAEAEVGQARWGRSQLWSGCGKLGKGWSSGDRAHAMGEEEGERRT